MKMNDLEVTYDYILTKDIENEAVGNILIHSWSRPKIKKGTVLKVGPKQTEVKAGNILHYKLMQGIELTYNNEKYRLFRGLNDVYGVSY